MNNRGQGGPSQLEGLIERLIAAATNPRDKAFISTLAATGMRVSQSVQINVTDIDFKRETLTIVHLKERVKLKCPISSQ